MTTDGGESEDNDTTTTTATVAMPHAVSMAAPGLQALILCGPGSSFTTFTTNADENPKALLPIANRPMVWYALEFCYRMGVTGMSPSLSLSQPCVMVTEEAGR